LLHQPSLNSLRFQFLQISWRIEVVNPAIISESLKPITWELGAKAAVKNASIFGARSDLALGAAGMNVESI